MAAALDYNVAHTVAASSLGVRPDGRGPAHGRAACLRLARDGDGATAEASLGRTRCVGRATCALGAPEPARPSEGTVRVHCELAPGAAAAAGADVEAVRRAVDACVRGCGAVDREALCVAVGVACWHVRCDVHVVHDDGGALEAAALAAAAALAHCRRPHVALDDAGRAAVVADADPVPLPLVRAPARARATAPRSSWTRPRPRSARRRPSSRSPSTSTASARRCPSPAPRRPRRRSRRAAPRPRPARRSSGRSSRRSSRGPTPPSGRRPRPRSAPAGPRA